MSFGKRLAELRKQRGLTQMQVCELVGIHVAQMRNYEAGRSQPTLEVIRKLALTLGVTADELVFDREERMPAITDKDLIRDWERLEGLPEEDRKAIKVLVEGLLLRHTLNRLHSTG
jgi:transcriptional regulator with XRE-family HTH domain